MQNEGHMVCGVTGAVKRAKSRPFRAKYLSILDVGLTGDWMVLVNNCVLAKREEIFHSSNMVRVPMGKKSFADGSTFGGKD